MNGCLGEGVALTTHTFNRARKVIVGLAALSAANMVHAQDGESQISLFTAYEIQSAKVEQQSRALGGGEFVLKQRLLPTGLAVVDAAINEPALKLSLPAGTQLISVGDLQRKVFCDATRYKKKANATAIG